MAYFCVTYITSNLDGKITIEGKVECKGELTLVGGLSDEYRQFVKDRTLKYDIKTRVYSHLFPLSFLVSFLFEC